MSTTIAGKCVCGSWVANNENAQAKHNATHKHQSYHSQEPRVRQVLKNGWWVLEEVK